MIRTGGAALALALLILLAPGAKPTSAQSNQVTWRACGSFECGSLQVPLDYSQPNGKQIELALARKPASEPGERIGSLLVNPGGPGGSGVDFVRAWSAVLHDDIRDRFDIVGWDPRGVGQSTPLVCHDTIQDYIAADPSPDNQEEWDRLEQVTRTFADDCADAAGDAIDHYGTKNVARDLDRIRAALGDEKLTYLGYSYGTVIGQAYLEQFPENVRAMVLDGAVDLSLDIDQLTITQAQGFERALANFAENCRARANRCNINEIGDPMEVVREVLADVEAAPIPSSDADRPAGPGEALLGIVASLYNQASWFQLDLALEDAMNGDGSRLVDLTDRYLDRQGQGYSNQTETNLAVNCIDNEPSQLPMDYRDYEEFADDLEAASPTFGRAFGNGLACGLWAAEPDPLSPLDGVEGAPTILVVSTTGDPATPYEWGVAVAEQIGDSVLLTFRGEGHTAYVSGDGCVDTAVNNYLLTLELPDDDATCGDGPAIPDGSPQTITPGDPDGAGRVDRGNSRGGRSEPVSNGWTVFGWLVLVLFLGATGAAIAITRRR